MHRRLALFTALLAAIAGYALHALAQPRVDVRPAMSPIASSSSNGVSFAWFYDASARSVVVCRAAAQPSDPIDCKAQTTLP